MKHIKNNRSKQYRLRLTEEEKLSSIKYLNVESRSY